MNFVSNVVWRRIKQLSGVVGIASALLLTACGSGTESAVNVVAPPIAESSSIDVSKKNTYTQAALPTVYRFAKISNGAYFYTGSDEEAQTILRDYPDFRYEGYAFLRDTAQLGQPVYRFANTRNGGYFYTASAVERDTVLRDYPHFRFEGSTFSVAPNTATEAKPVYRLANRNNGAYLYTSSAAERDYAISLGMWRSEGTAFNALSPLDGLNCVSSAGGGSGYILGVCSVFSGNTEANSVQFQNFPLTVTTDSSVAKRFTLNTQSPYLPGARTMDAANENCSDNQLGSKSGFLTEIYDDPTRPATSSRYSVISFAQTVGENTNFCRTPQNQTRLSAFNVVTGGDLALSDFGTWERYLGGASLYYAGWYALRTTTNATPQAGKTYAKGIAVGYRFAANLGYGMSADVVSGATWNGTSLTLQINNLAYSRRNLANPSVTPAIDTLTLSGTYSATTKKVSGLVSGTGVGGTFEGEFAGASGQEFVGKFQLLQAASGDRLAGAFAVK